MATSEVVVLSLLIVVAGLIGHKDTASGWKEVLLAVVSYLAVRFGGGRLLSAVTKKENPAE